MYLYKITGFTVLAVMGLLVVLVENNVLRSFLGELKCERNSEEMSQLERNSRTRLETSSETASGSPNQSLRMIIIAPTQRAKQRQRSKSDPIARIQQRKQLLAVATSSGLETHATIPSPSANSRISPQAVHFNLVNESTVELLALHNSLGVVERVDLPVSSSDVYISMKTTALNHKNRLVLLLATWLQTIDPSQVHILTDNISDPWIRAISDRGYNVLAATGCPKGHSRSSLCCRSGLEYQGYYNARKTKKSYRWFCHFDDDIYVNTVQLLRLLKNYDPMKEKIYLGHFLANLWRYHKLFQKETKKIKVEKWAAFPKLKGSSYAYATGASYCISNSLLDLLEEYFSGDNFLITCKKVRKPDDITVGIIVEAVLGYNLTDVPAMQTELQKLGRISPTQLQEMITIGYRHIYDHLDKNKNRVMVPNSPFTDVEDPTRFLSYHCLLYPRTSWCLTKRHWQ